MARAVPGVRRHGTAKDLADHGVGYVSSGEGEFSRRAASSGNINLRGNVSRRKGRSPNASVADQIAYQQSELARIRGNLLLTNSPAKMVALKDLVEKKRVHIAKLENEK